MIFPILDRFRTPALFLILLFSPSIYAQAVPSAVTPVVANNSASENEPGPQSIASAQRKFNLATILASQHDSSAGWQGSLTPSLSYRWNEHLSFDLSTPIYLDVSTTAQGGTTLHPTSVTTTSATVPGDTIFATHLALASPSSFTYVATPTFTFPSGDSSAGLGTGSFQYDFNNHFGWGDTIQPQVDIGIGNSSAIVSRRVRRPQNSSGLQSHFEAGMGLSLPHRIQSSASAYELLPISDQTVYSTQLVRGRRQNRVSGVGGLAEDNGFNTTLDVPIQRHMTVSGFYSHSLRQQVDTVGMSVALSVRGASSQ